MLPTTQEGYMSAIGQYIMARVNANIARDHAAFVASGNADNPDFNPYAPKATARKRTEAEALADFCTMVRARQGRK